MRRSTSGLAALFLLLLTSIIPALAADEARIAISGSPKQYPPGARFIFLTDIREITAAVTLPGNEKTTVEFVWTAPDGSVFSDTVKIIFPAPGAGPATGRDTLKVYELPPALGIGWWSVEAAFADRKLSGRFLLTNNRQLMAIAHGDRGEKLLALTGMDTGAEGAKDALEIALEDKDVKVRVAAVKALARSGEGWAVGMLDKGLMDPAPQVRAAAVGALIALGGDSASGSAEKALSDTSRDVRKAIVDGLTRIDAAWSTALLGRFLKDGDLEVRTLALGALSGREGPDAVKALSDGREAGDGEFRLSVLAVLVARKTGAGTIIPWLKDTDPDVRLLAVNEIGESAGPGDAAAMRPLAADPSDKVASAALDALVRLNDIEGVARAFDGGGLKARRKAVSLLARLKGKSAADGLAAAMKDENIDIRRAALAGLLNMGRDGLPGLMVGVSDTDMDIRLGAVSGLAALGTDEAGPGMTKAISDPEPSIRLKAAEYFIRRGGPAMPSVLMGLACDESRPVRNLGLAALIGTPGPESSKSLSAYYACGDPAARETVVDVLSARGDKAALGCLESALKDDGAGIRLKAAAGLLAAGVKAPLFPLAEDADPGVKRVALTAMSEEPSPDMLPVLGKLAKDPDEGVRLLVLEALKGIPDDESGRLISGAVSDERASVRAAARELVLSRRDAGVVDGLYTIAVSDDRAFAGMALAALDEIPGAGADDAILGVYRNGARGVRATALGMLARRGEDVFCKAETEAVSGADATIALDALGLAGSLPSGMRERVYRSAMTSAHREVREAGIRGLSGIGGESGKGALLSSLEDKDPGIRLNSLNALARLSDPGLADRLTALVQDPDPSVRAAALSASLRLGDDKKKADALLSAADGPNPDVAGQAVDALVPMGDGRALDAFMRAFTSGYKRGDMLRGMAAVKGDAAVEYIARAFSLAGDDGRLRLIAVRELSGRGPAALPVLTEALKDPDRDVRLQALRGILATEMSAPERLKLLGQALADPYLEVRRLSLSAIGDIPGMEAARLMYGVLGDVELCDPALRLLLERPEPDITSELAALAHGIKDPAFRARVVRSVFERGLAANDALAFMDDESQAVRGEAARALSERTGADAAYGLLVLGGEPELTETSASGLSRQSTGDVRAGLMRMFEKGMATKERVAFAASHITEPGLLSFIVDSVAADDTTLMRAALFPVARGLAPYSLQAALKGLKSHDVKLREDIASAVAGLDSPDTGAAMKEIYETHPELRFSLFEAARKHGRVKVLLPLAIKDKEERLRREAASLALKEGYLEGLYIASADESAGIRLIASEGLAKDAAKEAPVLLGRLVQDKDDAVASAAFKSLMGMKDSVPPGVWAELAVSPDARADARLAAVKAIAGLESPAYASTLAASLGDEDGDVAKTARAGLVRLGRDALPALHGLLGDGRLGLHAIGLIKQIGDSSSEAPILAALPKMDLAQRLAAVDTLAKVGGPEVLEELAGLYREGPDELKKAVLMTLGALSFKGYEPALVELISDGLSSGDEGIRICAARDAGGLRVTSLMARLAAGPGPGASDALKAAYGNSLATLRFEHGMLVYRLENGLSEALASNSGDAYPILIALYNDYEADVRVRAVEALKGFPPEKSDALLLGALDDGSEAVRRAAGEQVVSRGGDVMLDGLSKVAVSGWPGLGERAVVALSKLPGTRPEEALKEALKKGGPDARLAALEALSKRDSNPMPDAVRAVLDDPSPEIRKEAAEILTGRAGADSVYGLLVLAGRDDAKASGPSRMGLSGRKPEELMDGTKKLIESGRATPETVALAAGFTNDGYALAGIVESIKPSDTHLLRAALGPALARHAPGDLPAIVKGFKAEDLGIKEELASTLAGMDAPGSADALRKVYEEQPELKMNLLSLAVKNRRAMDLLPLACNDRDEPVRAAAVELAVREGYWAGVAAAADDASAHIRKTVAEGLQLSPGNDSPEVLARLAQDGDRAVSSAALYSLSALGEKVPSSIWAGLAIKGRGALRLAAVRSLAERREAGNAAMLARALSDEDEDVVKAASEGLAGIGKGALPALHPLLGDERLQPLVLRILGEIADPTSEAPILSAFPKMDAQWKLEAVDALGKLGGPGSLDTLYGLYREGGQDARASVLKAVSGLKLKGDEKVLAELLRDALSDKNDNIKFRAAQAAGRLKVVSVAGIIEQGPGPGASSLLVEQYGKTLKELKGQGRETGSISP